MKKVKIEFANLVFLMRFYKRYALGYIIVTICFWAAWGPIELSFAGLHQQRDYQCPCQWFPIWKNTFNSRIYSSGEYSAVDDDPVNAGCVYGC